MCYENSHHDTAHRNHPRNEVSNKHCDSSVDGMNMLQYNWFDNILCYGIVVGLSPKREIESKDGI